MSMTLEQAKALRNRDVIHSEADRNSNDNCRRWKVTGKVKTWKRSPERIKVPVAHGLWNHGYLKENDLDMVHLESECPREQHKLIIKSLHDGQCECTCGKWFLSVTGSITKEYAKANHETHIRRQTGFITREEVKDGER